MLDQIHLSKEGPMKIFVDNTSAIKLARNPVAHGRSKHNHIRFHFLRDLDEKQKIELKYCEYENQIVDILTKPLKYDAFFKCRNLLGITVILNQN